MKRGAPIGALDRPRHSPLEKPTGLCLKPGNGARPTPLVEDRSPQALVRGKWSLSAALVVFSVVVSASGQPSNAPQEALPTLTTAHAAHSLQLDEARRGYPVRLRASPRENTEGGQEP